MHARLQHCIQRSGGTGNRDAGLVNEHVYAVARVSERLVQTHRVRQELLHALFGLGKYRQRKHKERLQIEGISGQQCEVEAVVVRRTDQLESDGAGVRREHRS